MRLEFLRYRSPDPAAAERPPLLYVHGAWHGAWCWNVHMLPYTARQGGYHSFALSLRGHGASDGSVRFAALEDYLDDIAQAAAQVHSETGRQPVLVGHSMGGYLVQHYLARYRPPAGPSAGVLMATIPVTGPAAFFLRLTARSPLSMAATTLKLSPQELVRPIERAHLNFFSPDMPRVEVKRYYARLGQESIRFSLEGSLRLPQSTRVQVPVLVLAAERDRIFTLAEQQRTARAYGTEAVVIPGMAHDMMLERNWQDAADIMLRWLAEHGL